MTALTPEAARALAVRFASVRGLSPELADDCAHDALAHLAARGLPLTWRTVRDAVTNAARKIQRTERREQSHDTRGDAWAPSPPLVLLSVRDAERATVQLSPLERDALRARLEGEVLGPTGRDRLRRARRRLRAELLSEG